MAPEAPVIPTINRRGDEFIGKDPVLVIDRVPLGLSTTKLMSKRAGSSPTEHAPSIIAHVIRDRRNGGPAGPRGDYSTANGTRKFVGFRGRGPLTRALNWIHIA